MIKSIKFSALLLTILVMAACTSKKEKTTETTETVEETTTTTTASVKDINLEASTVHWKGQMLKMYSHEGNIALKEANLLMADGKLAGGSFVVDMTTITPTDDNYNAAEGKTAEKLVGHLSSPDFFDVANHPTASFEIKTVNENSAVGTLTVRGKTGEETIQNITMNEDGTVSGTLTFNRKNYDVAFDHPMKEMVLSNDIELDITLAVK
ncbi:MAG: YceI family protein [Chitinophagales bacterium]